MDGFAGRRKRTLSLLPGGAAVRTDCAANTPRDGTLFHREHIRSPVHRFHPPSGNGWRIALPVTTTVACTTPATARAHHAYNAANPACHTGWRCATVNGGRCAT